ncbi:MAG: BMP family ABC transporter substrate-binding protein [Pseudonocardia sp.]|nr:BMP family ABC transporter substrate-binding protein [Pseudonocardia sp.]
MSEGHSVRIRRGFVVTAALLASALMVTGCARDTSAGGEAPAAGGGGATACATGTPPSGGAAAAAPTSAPATKPDASALKVGVAYDIGGRGDQSFNDAAFAGVEKAVADFGLLQSNVKELTAAPNEPEDAAATRLRQLAADGYNPIIAVGFKYAGALGTVAAELPNTKFAIVDDSSIKLPNVTSLVFAEEQGSFLVGVAAALKSKACHIGFVGGVDVPLIQKFEAGYIQGAKAVAPNIKIESKYITPAGDFTGFQDPQKGSVVATGELDAGADVIYHAAGASGAGVFSAVKAKSTPDAPKYAIGVDSDQYKTADPAVRDVIITSMLKRVDVAVHDYIGAVATGDLTGLPKIFDLKVNGVGYSTTGGKIDDIVAKLEAYKNAIISGAITVKTTT